MSLLPLKAQLPPKGRSRQPCPGSGFGSTVAKKTYLYQQLPKSKGIVSNHLTGTHEAPPTFQLHISLCLTPMHTLSFLLPCSPAQPLTPHPTGRVGLEGPLCSLQHRTSSAYFTCLCLLLDVSSVRPRAFGAVVLAPSTAWINQYLKSEIPVESAKLQKEISLIKKPSKVQISNLWHFRTFTHIDTHIPCERGISPEFTEMKVDRPLCYAPMLPWR